LLSFLVGELKTKQVKKEDYSNFFCFLFLKFESEPWFGRYEKEMCTLVTTISLLYLIVSK
jgi:hypothetical protein